MNNLKSIKLKYVFEDIFKGRTPLYDDEPNDYIIFGQRNNTKKGFSFDNCKYANEKFYNMSGKKEFLRYGDIVINSLGGGTCGRVGFFDLNDTSILTDGIPYILRKKINSKYIYYILYTMQSDLEQLALGATNQLSLKDLDILNYSIDINEDIDKQREIVDYLDIKTKIIENIDYQVSKQIEVLELYKRSMIIETVTKGNKKGVEMKNSGIEYVGNIPNYWNVHPVYYYFTEGKSKNRALLEDNLLSLSYGKIVRRDINTNDGLLPSNFSTYNVVNKNDIIIRPTDLQNDKKSLRTGLVKEKGIITSAYIDLVPKKDTYSKYFHYLLHAYDLMKVFYNMGNGVR
ncbi:hypothetical protein [Liberiplasma polymorphum]|uniref:hypothetical protein n=1 Tax=Liberiplasma polymorphum TaxID=3374570 RepID=UPI0037755B6F